MTTLNNTTMGIISRPQRYKRIPNIEKKLRNKLAKIRKIFSIYTRIKKIIKIKDIILTTSFIEK